MKTNQPKFKQTEIGLIPEEWEVKKVKDIAYVTMGQSPPGESYNNIGRGIKFLQGVKTFGNKYPFFDTYTTCITKKAKEGSVLLSVRAPVGEVNITREEICIGRGLASLFMKNGNNEFLYYLLKNYKSLLIEKETGSVFGSINNSHILNLELPIPNDNEQRAIAKILSDLDAKIELNQQMNKTLEEIGKALFKRWFVDFEFPNEEGKPYKSSGGKMVYNEELGKEIPKGWRVGRLGEVGSFKNGVNYLRNEKGDTEFYIVNVRDISNNKFLYKESLDKICMDYIKAKEYLLHEKDIIIARSACPGEVSIVLSNLNDVIYSGFSIRYRVNNPENWLYIFLVLQELKKSLFLFSVGTTLTSVNQETLKNMNFIMPPQEILEKFNLIINSLFDKIKNNLYESLTLSQIRDLLLSKLMTGKIRVPVHKVNINSPAHEVQANSPAHEVQAGKEQL